MATVVNTNMAVGAFHRRLKVCCMEKKNNRSIDRLLHILFKIARDEVFEQIIKTQKGKTTHCLSEINKRYKVAADTVQSREVVPVSDMLWKVKSSNSQQPYYTVTKVRTEDCSCSIRCKSCGVCVHTFTCTCMDFIVHSTICEHIHFINILYVGTVKNTDLEEPVPSRDLDEPMTSLEYLENQLHSVSTKHTTAKNKALALCKKIEVSLLECTNTDAKVAGAKHLQSALTVINAVQLNT